MNPINTAELLDMQRTFVLVLEEIDKARAKFPEAALTTIALTEEVGEVAQAVHNEFVNEVNAEIIQVMCLCVRLIYEGDFSTNQHRIQKGLGVLGLTKQHLRKGQS